MRIHQKMMDWKAVARISVAGWAASSLLAALAAWLWFLASMPPLHFRLLWRVILARGLELVGVQARTPWLYGHSPSDFLGRLDRVGLDLSPQLDILSSLPLAGLAAVLAGWAIYLTHRRS